MPNYSGMWTLQAQMQAAGQDNWTGIVQNKLYSWGSNANGVLGQNNTISLSSPTQVGADTTWLSISMGSYASFSVKKDGTLWAWGSNGMGQLGQNDTVYRSSPTQIGALTDWKQVSCGDYSVFAVKTNGTLWSWGQNNKGQLGQNNTIALSSPTQVGAGTTWLRCFMGSGSGTYGFGAAIKTDNTLWVCGNNRFGELGQNDRVYRSSPVQVGALTNWSDVSGRCMFIAKKTDNTLWSWGRNNVGQLGQNNTIYRSSPVQVGALTTWLQVNSAYNLGAIKNDGTIWVCGKNFQGQLGQNDQAYRSSPVQIGSGTNWTNIASSTLYHILATKSDGTLWACGYNASGQLGQNDLISRSSPVQVGSATTWSTICCGPSSNMGIQITTT